MLSEELLYWGKPGSRLSSTAILRLAAEHALHCKVTEHEQVRLKMLRAQFDEACGNA